MDDDGVAVVDGHGRLIRTGSKGPKPSRTKTARQLDAELREFVAEQRRDYATIMDAISGKGPPIRRPDEAEYQAEMENMRKRIDGRMRPLWEV